MERHSSLVLMLGTFDGYFGRLEVGWFDKEKYQFTVRYLTYFDVNYLDMKGLTLLGFPVHTCIHGCIGT